jgi:hypothetical protein
MESTLAEVKIFESLSGAGRGKCMRLASVEAAYL